MPEKSVPKSKYSPYNGVVLYHWDKCGHCIQFRETWNRLYDYYNKMMPMISIELKQMQRLPQEAQVSAFPTIRMYSNGHITNYEGPRDFGSLQKTIDTNIKSKIKPKAKKPKTK
jgi:thioredoxin-like negative regulator of GroEL